MATEWIVATTHEFDERSFAKEATTKSIEVEPILASGAHHTGFNCDVTSQHLQDFTDIANIEKLLIDENTNLNVSKKELRWNDLYYRLANGL